MILGEKLEREENLEKKRKFSKEREKSQEKENFFRRDFFPEKILFSFFCQLLMLLLLLQTLLKVLTLPMLPFSCLFTFFLEDLEKIHEKRISSEKISPGKKSLFHLRFFSFSREFSLFL